MNVCFFGASSDAIDPALIEGTERFGELLAERGHTLVYGAGATGLMGAAARGVHRAGGRVVGITPADLFDVGGLLYRGCDEMLTTETMHERKAFLRAMGDVFVIAPGGVGTFDEFFEVLTLRQLGVVDKPIGILNLAGACDALLSLLEKTIEGGFMSPECRALYHSEADPAALLAYLEQASTIPPTHKNYAFYPAKKEK